MVSLKSYCQIYLLVCKIIDLLIISLLFTDIMLLGTEWGPLTY